MTKGALFTMPCGYSDIPARPHSPMKVKGNLEFFVVHKLPATFPIRLFIGAG